VPIGALLPVSLASVASAGRALRSRPLSVESASSPLPGSAFVWFTPIFVYWLSCRRGQRISRSSRSRHGPSRPPRPKRSAGAPRPAHGEPFILHWTETVPMPGPAGAARPDDVRPLLLLLDQTPLARLGAPAGWKSASLPAPLLHAPPDLCPVLLPRRRADDGAPAPCPPGADTPDARGRRPVRARRGILPVIEPDATGHVPLPEPLSAHLPARADSRLSEVAGRHFPRGAWFCPRVPRPRVVARALPWS